MSASSWAYLQTRLQARHALFLDPEAWQRLDAAPGYAVFLKQARLTPLEQWLQTLPTEGSPHNVEAWLRERFQQRVEEVASWMPKPWRAAVQWVQWLPMLPALRHAAEGRPLLPWMERDPRLRAGGAEASALAPLLEAARRGRPVLEVWLEQWRSAWPQAAPAKEMESLARRLLRHGERFALLGGADEAWKARQSLRQELTFAFRRHGGTPVAGFLHLALVALELERLRGALSRRALFGVGGEA